MKKPKIYLGTIYVDRGAIPPFYISLADLAGKRLVELVLSTYALGDGALRQLNRRTDQFLYETTADYFWLQGNDTDFEPPYIARMASHGLPIVGGLFPIKEPKLRWCVQTKPGCEPDPVTGLVEVRATGLECMLIHRDVFLKMQREDLAYRDNMSGGLHNRRHFNYWRWERRPDPGLPGEHILQSEDYLFCEEAAALGFPIHVDMTDYCGHWDGRTRYPFGEVPSEPLLSADPLPRAASDT